ncbi:hypothetical protein CS033_01472 [Phocaeicola vulgatus]|nr:hypothetical protein [Phocaeicola vulgatus]
MYTVAQPVKIKKIYHNGNHLENKGNFCLSGSGDGTDVDISGYCEYIIEQHDDERGDSVLHQCFVVGVKSDNPIITKQCDSYQRKTDGISHFDDFVADRKNTFLLSGS